MKKYIAEFLGTFFLVSVVVGSGIMAANLSSGNDGVALLGNTIATGAILFVIIKMFGPISGAHFNPIVSFIFFLRKELSFKSLWAYILIQVISGILAVFLIHYIFNIEILQISNHSMRVPNAPFSLLVSEIVATFGLIATILFIRKNDDSSVAIGVALFITAGYWFTSSTSFANPAVTIARMFTDTFTGISPSSVPYFLFGQLIGGLLIHYLFNILDDK